MIGLKDIEQSPSPWSGRGWYSSLCPAQPAGDGGRLRLWRVQGSKYTLIKFQQIAKRKIEFEPKNIKISLKYASFGQKHRKPIIIKIIEIYKENKNYLIYKQVFDISLKRRNF